MILVRKHITTETAHRLMDYVGKCARIHGHSYKWEVEIEALIQRNGIAVDFSRVKHLLQEQIHVPYDHMLVLCKDDPVARLFGEPPMDYGICKVPFNPTAENLAKDAAQRIIKQLGANEYLISLTCWETENSYAKFVL